MSNESTPAVGEPKTALSEEELKVVEKWWNGHSRYLVKRFMAEVQEKGESLLRICGDFDTGKARPIYHPNEPAATPEARSAPEAASAEGPTLTRPVTIELPDPQGLTIQEIEDGLGAALEAARKSETVATQEGAQEPKEGDRK